MKTGTIKDIKTSGYYVYAHQTPDKMVYFGVSQMATLQKVATLQI